MSTDKDASTITLIVGFVIGSVCGGAFMYQVRPSPEESVCAFLHGQWTGETVCIKDGHVVKVQR